MWSSMWWIMEWVMGLGSGGSCGDGLGTNVLAGWPIFTYGDSALDSQEGSCYRWWRPGESFYVLEVV